VSRKQPVAIVSDDEDEELSEASPSESDGRHHRNQVQETDDEGMHNSSSEEGQSDEGDFDDGAEGLQELDGRSLMSTLRSEVKHFSCNVFRSLAHCCFCSMHAGLQSLKTTLLQMSSSQLLQKLMGGPLRTMKTVSQKKRSTRIRK